MEASRRRIALDPSRLASSTTMISKERPVAAEYADASAISASRDSSTHRAPLCTGTTKLMPSFIIVRRVHLQVDLLVDHSQASHPPFGGPCRRTDVRAARTRRRRRSWL